MTTNIPQSVLGAPPRRLARYQCLFADPLIRSVAGINRRPRVPAGLAHSPRGSSATRGGPRRRRPAQQRAAFLILTGGRGEDALLRLRRWRIRRSGETRSRPSSSDRQSRLAERRQGKRNLRCVPSLRRRGRRICRNELAMAQLTLEERVDRLESIEAIKRLKAVYCMYCDAKYDAEGICSLFTEDGVWDGGPSFGRYEGHDQIRKFFEGISGDIVFAAHLVLNPIITVEGNKAHGRWWLHMPCTAINDAGNSGGPLAAIRVRRRLCAHWRRLEVQEAASRRQILRPAPSGLGGGIGQRSQGVKEHAFNRDGRFFLGRQGFPIHCASTSALTGLHEAKKEVGS